MKQSIRVTRPLSEIDVYPELSGHTSPLSCSRLPRRIIVTYSRPHLFVKYIVAALDESFSSRHAFGPTRQLRNEEEPHFHPSVMQIGFSETLFLSLQLDLLYEGYKRTEIKAIPKVHELMEWLRENIPKDDKKPGRK